MAKVGFFGEIAKQNAADSRETTGDSGEGAAAAKIANSNTPNPSPFPVVTGQGSKAKHAA